MKRSRTVSGATTPATGDPRKAPPCKSTRRRKPLISGFPRASTSIFALEVEVAVEVIGATSRSELGDEDSSANFFALGIVRSDVPRAVGAGGEVAISSEVNRLAGQRIAIRIFQTDGDPAVLGEACETRQESRVDVQ